MTNDLLERELPQGEEPAEEETPEAQEAGGTPGEQGPLAPPEDAPPEQEKTVFAPSAWERRSAKNAEADARRAGHQAQKAQKESDRQQQAADRETKKLELQLAREERKARDEERRQEQKRLDEERRRERKAREEEERLLRQEEKAKRKTVRRVGTMTLGLSLIAIGAAVLMYLVNPGFDLRVVAYLAPLILIGLGVETLIRYFFSKDRTYRFDFASGVVCILLVMGSCFVALIPELMYYVSPRRFAAEEQLLQAERDKLYQAFKGEQRVADYYVYGDVQSGLPSAQKDENGDWVYQLSYLRTNISLLDGYESKEDFARVCRELMDKVIREDAFGKNFSLYMGCPVNSEGVRYELEVDNRLQLEMGVEALAKLTNEIYTRPSLENGWLPNGYSEIEASYGTVYAECFADLIENYSEDELNIYYDLLMMSGRPDLAMNYYNSLKDQEQDQEPPETAGEPENSSEPPAEDAEGSEPPAASGEESPVQSSPEQEDSQTEPPDAA